ncbi:ABC transporter permease subunit [Nonomuraea gerenzanensis]|uniref:FIG00761799: membrane protein n=1 Tax=Nonomuraea gerenzanensis TaxID=93944 RepID=A0A1M4EDI3_9ACTN|nr:ABC transporter permease subunit [Nonomuraea gerenzanensis]UBU08487.1 ABC transporter permease subunit [Nonomuraea gerenzanensis]SBO96832.1 FIG00761799: membrane protein [Nonomuraea gerenzanensis]
MRRHLHAEWTKLRTLPGTGRLLLTIVVLTAAVSVAASAVVSCTPAGCGYDPARILFFGVQVSQALVAVLAVTAISGEYGTGMIRLTLTAMPHRTGVLAAKAILLAVITLITGTAAVLAAALTARHLLLGNGFPAGMLDLMSGPNLRAAAGSVLYLTLIALLSLGVATAVRDSATAVGVVLGLLYLFPALILMISDAGWQRLLWQISPMNAGLAVQATTGLAALPLSPWAGLGVLAAWAAAALLGGGLLLRVRDA